MQISKFTRDLPRGLKDLDGFSHLHILTHLHVGAPGGLHVVPFLDAPRFSYIKPYVPEFDSIAAERTGWLASAARNVHHVRADRRFEDR